MKNKGSVCEEQILTVRVSPSVNFALLGGATSNANEGKALKNSVTEELCYCML